MLIIYVYVVTLFQVNFSELSRKYGAAEKTKVGNMVVKEFLIKSGVDLEKFRTTRKNAEPAPRRRLNRMYGGGITTPVPRTNAAIQVTLKSKILSGEYRLGEIITPRRYKKLMLHPDGTLKEEYFTVSGRKIPLLEIRKVLLEEHEKQGLVRDHSDGHYNEMATEEIKSRLTELGELKAADNTREELLALLKSHERTRQIMIWSDHSSIMNHGHILLTANAIYDLHSTTPLQNSKERMFRI